MSEPSKQYIGDGSDNYAEAASKTAETVRKLKQATAAGAATGGFGTAASAVWSLRHTLFKILVCVCLALLFIIVMVVSLPMIIFSYIFGIDGEPPESDVTPQSLYKDMAYAVTDIIDEGYDNALEKTEALIEEGGYDYELSMDNLTDYARGTAGYDICYILAAYSASMNQQNTSKADMLSKLDSVSEDMFPVTCEEKEAEKKIPAVYYTYKPIKVTVITGKEKTGTVNKKPQYRYETKEKTYYVKDAKLTADKPSEIPAFKKTEVSVPVYTDGKITSEKKEAYFEADGTVTIEPVSLTVSYLECTIHQFNNDIIEKAFGIDLDEIYDQYNVTYSTAIRNMAKSLKLTVYGTGNGVNSVPLTEEELIDFVERQKCSAVRKEILSTALSLVGKVPYFWGGKSSAGWNDEWNTPKLVTAAGDSSTGTIMPFGLDCSGFTDWTYKTSVGVSLYAGTGSQWDNSTGITEAELLPGDLGFLMNDDGQDWNHVLIFAGYDEDGKRMWVHSSGGEGVILNTPSYEADLALRRPKDVDFNGIGEPEGSPVSTFEADITYYCACTKCCGENACGITASGKQIERGMIAMSSHYPFGTKVMIDGIIYTVEDRGGSGIENDLHRIDIYVPDHNEALRLGRRNAVAAIY